MFGLFPICYREVHLFFSGKFTLLQLAMCMDVRSILIWSSLFYFFEVRLALSLRRRREVTFLLKRRGENGSDTLVYFKQLVHLIWSSLGDRS
jgi:hypothetical protein